MPRGDGNVAQFEGPVRRQGGDDDGCQATRFAGGVGKAKVGGRQCVRGIFVDGDGAAGTGGRFVEVSNRQSKVAAGVGSRCTCRCDLGGQRGSGFKVERGARIQPQFVYTSGGVLFDCKPAVGGDRDVFRAVNVGDDEISHLEISGNGGAFCNRGRCIGECYSRGDIIHRIERKQTGGGRC